MKGQHQTVPDLHGLTLPCFEIDYKHPSDTFPCSTLLPPWVEDVFLLVEDALAPKSFSTFPSTAAVL
jgi:hypothetical protein